MSNILKRLREYDEHDPIGPLAKEAADEIERFQKEYIVMMLDLLGLLHQDEDNAVTGIFSGKTIDKMNELRAKIADDLANHRLDPLSPATDVGSPVLTHEKGE